MSATTSKEFIVAKGYDYEGVVVDVYATEGAEGWEMSSVKLAGDKRDLLPLLGVSEFRYFDALVDRLWASDRRAARRERAMDGAAHLMLSH